MSLHDLIERIRKRYREAGLRLRSDGEDGVLVPQQAIEEAMRETYPLTIEQKESIDAVGQHNMRVRRVYHKAANISLMVDAMVKHAMGEDTLVIPGPHFTLYADGSGSFHLPKNLPDGLRKSIKKFVEDQVGSVRWNIPEEVVRGFELQRGRMPSPNECDVLRWCHMRID